MRAAQLEATGLAGLRVSQVERPTPGPDEVVIAVSTVAVNQLDLNVIAGIGPGRAARLPRTLGLDPAGVIVEVGSSVDAGRVGESVVVKPNVPCGRCSWCAAGSEADCPSQTVIGVHRDGGAAEFVAVPARSAFAIGDLDFAVATAAVHSAAIALHALEVVGIGEGSTVLVTGASGAVGGAAIELAVHRGATVIAVSRHDLPHRAGVTNLVVAEPSDIEAAVRAIASDGVDVAVDSSGHAAVTGAAVSALGWRGRAVFCAASVSNDLAIDSRDFYLNRKALLGSASADYRDVRAALDLVALGVVRPVIAERFALDDIAAAYAAFTAARPAGKVIVDVA